MPRRLSLLALPLVVLVLASLSPAQPAGKALPLWSLREALAQQPTGEALKKLEQQIIEAVGASNLQRGIPPRLERFVAFFAVRTDPTAADKAFVRLDGQRLAMQPLGAGSRLSVLFKDLPNCTLHDYAYEVESAKTSSSGDSGDRSLSRGTFQVEFYNPHPDSLPKPEVPKGTVKRATWTASKVFPGTTRDWAVYVPVQCQPGGPPACVMVFQDGISYLGGDLRAPTVFDNLIHRGELPPIVGVFINPGQHTDRAAGRSPSNRSFEYDTLADAYARFLLDEMLPEAEKLAGVKLRTEPASRAICGRSSGGICAFTVAWERPSEFGKVLSTIGSFTNIRGGDVYPGRIRKTAKKDIRI